MTPAPAKPDAPKNSVFWKNPWVIAAVVGVVALTAQRVLAPKMLKAAPPGPSLGAWELKTVEGQPFGSAQLLGKVWIASFAHGPQEQTEVGNILRHVEDLDDKVVLVSFVLPGAPVPVRLPGTEHRWVVLTGSQAQLDALVLGHFRPALLEFTQLEQKPIDAGTTTDEFTRVSVVALVDQNGALRGFRPSTELGRGILISGARLLAKHGPNP